MEKREHLIEPPSHGIGKPPSDSAKEESSIPRRMLSNRISDPSGEAKRYFTNRKEMKPLRISGICNIYSL